jgi:hypothetical protein
MSCLIVGQTGTVRKQLCNQKCDGFPNPRTLCFLVKTSSERRRDGGVGASIRLLSKLEMVPTDLRLYCSGHTIDPGVPDKGQYEINLTTQADPSKQLRTFSFASVDANYGISPRILRFSGVLSLAGARKIARPLNPQPRHSDRAQDCNARENIWGEGSSTWSRLRDTAVEATWL